MSPALVKPSGTAGKEARAPVFTMAAAHPHVPPMWAMRSATVQPGQLGTGASRLVRAETRSAVVRSRRASRYSAASIEHRLLTANSPVDLHHFDGHCRRTGGRLLEPAAREHQSPDLGIADQGRRGADHRTDWRFSLLPPPTSSLRAIPASRAHYGIGPGHRWCWGPGIRRGRPVNYPVSGRHPQEPGLCRRLHLGVAWPERAARWLARASTTWPDRQLHAPPRMS